MIEKNPETSNIDRLEDKVIYKETESLDELALNSEKVSKEIKSLDDFKEPENEISSLDEISGIKPEPPKSFSEEDIEIHRIMAEDSNKLLHEKFNSYLNEDKKRIDIARISQFERSDNFREHILQKYPDIPKEELTGMVGYSDGKRIFMDSDADKARQFQSLNHEGLHVLSSHEVRRNYGEKLDDGITEHFTKQITPLESSIKDIKLEYDSNTRNLIGIKDQTPQYYKGEDEIVSMIHSHVGQETLAKAYFQGDINSLENKLDSSTGIKNTLKAVSEKLEKKEYKEAKKILSSRR